MDFHTLSRKELQALCKKNKIPANMTNVAMANALADLPQVEGLDEFLNSVDSDAQKFPDEKGIGTPDIRTASRTSTRRKPAVEPESCQVSTRLRRTRAGNGEGIEQENKDLNGPVTPAVPSSRKRVPAVTTRRKKEDEKLIEHVHKTPAASRSRLRATSAYNTRRSVRLLEKNLSKMNIMDTEETGSDGVSEEMISVSQQIEDSADTEKGASSQTVSTEDLEKTNEVEVTSLEKNTGYECQSNDSKSAVQSDLEVADDAGASSQKVSAEDLEKINELEVTSSENNTGYECQLNDSKSEVENDAGDSLQAEPQDCPGEINELQAPSEKCDDSDEVSEYCDESEVDLTKETGKEVDDNNEAGTEISCDSSEPDRKISLCAKNDVSSFEEDASLEATEDKQKEDEHLVMENDYQNSELMNKAAESDVLHGAVENDASVEAAEEKTNEMDDSVDAENKAVKMDDLNEIYVTEDASVGDVEDKQEENQHSNEANDIQNSELISAKKEAGEMDDLAEFVDESKEFVEKDASPENSVADTQICIEPPMVVKAEAEAVPETIDFHTDKDIEQCKEQVATEETLDAFHSANQTLSTVTCTPICTEKQTRGDYAVEVQTTKKMSNQEENDQKENLNNVDLHTKSMRELKKMLRNLSLDGKTSTKNSNPVHKEEERKRTALQVLPENRMTASNGQSE